MASLTTIFRNGASGTQQTDKLLDLFRNRIELKKEFAALRNEKYMLQDRIKQHRGATNRVQQQLDHLENLLQDPDWMYNVVAFYQLRQLTSKCADQLARFAEELKQQSEQRVQKKILVSWKQQCEQKSDLIESRLDEHRMTLQMLEDRLQAERHKLMTMNGFVRLFRGRAIAAEIGEISAQLESAQSQENELLQTLSGIETLDPPDHQGLDIAAKRAINFMILSFAQHLYLYFEADHIIDMAKEACEKSVGAVQYGDKKECNSILKRLEKTKDAAEADTDFADILKQRSKLISASAKFRHDDDAMPIPASVATVYAITANGSVQEKSANLLGENYFGIAKVVSR